MLEFFICNMVEIYYHPVSVMRLFYTTFWPPSWCPIFTKSLIHKCIFKTKQIIEMYNYYFNYNYKSLDGNHNINFKTKMYINMLSVKKISGSYYWLNKRYCGATLNMDSRVYVSDDKYMRHDGSTPNDFKCLLFSNFELIRDHMDRSRK